MGAKNLTLGVMKKKSVFLCGLALLFILDSFAQAGKYNLLSLLGENKLESSGKILKPLTDGKKKGISTDGIVWLKDIHFSKGTIEVDLRGKDSLQRSFLGIAFHGVDTSSYDGIYFRPFNFQTSDPIRKEHMVQYISLPRFTWQYLRSEFNGVYEKGIDPPPSPNGWLHAKIVVGDKDIKVYVNHSSTPSLTVQKLNDRQDGKIGLWSGDLPGDFANLVISE
ncbi:MAG: hypothetical protein C5B59_11555 [Bacteroidetes bacterium]|nr:MAG: hypothetical protein C5B59_11555 [Bacteroidota bacterium]